MSAIFVFIMVSGAFFVPAITIGATPLPIGYGIAACYVLFRQPVIPSRQIKIFVIACLYLAIVSARNAIDDRGDLRDFLYLFICFGQMATFCMMKDLFDRKQGDRILQVATVCALLNLMLMILQAFDIFGIDESLQNLWAIPWELVRRDDLTIEHARSVHDRVFGLMNGFNIASTTMYLVFRAGWVRYRQSRYHILSLLSLLVSAARMLSILFVAFEVVAMFFSRTQRKNAIFLIVGGGVISCIFLFVAAHYLKGFLLFQFASEVSNEGLKGSYSYTNRLETLRMAADNLDKIFLFGGIHSNDFLNLSRAVDSEILLRSLQFGWLGFVLLVLMLYYYFDQYRSLDMLFLLALMLWTSVTFTGASNFQFTPFLLLYGFVCRDDFLRKKGVKMVILAPNDSSPHGVRAAAIGADG